jgi:hypothetical protein
MVLNIPETLNELELQKILEKTGKVFKIEFKQNFQGNIISFKTQDYNIWLK